VDGERESEQEKYSKDEEGRVRKVSGRAGEGKKDRQLKRYRARERESECACVYVCVRVCVCACVWSITAVHIPVSLYQRRKHTIPRPPGRDTTRILCCNVTRSQKLVK